MQEDTLEPVRHLLQPRLLEGAEYFALELDASDRGKIVWGAQTRWTGFTTGSPRYEIREASIVIAQRMWEVWQTIGEPCLTINTLDEFGLYLVWGGNALLRREIAESRLPDVLKPYPVVQRAGIVGWIGIDKLADSERQHAPTPKVRMKAIGRDKKRCMICGRRPADDVHVQLEVHHIRTWATGGVTEIDNLITLCSIVGYAVQDEGEDPSNFFYCARIAGRQRVLAFVLQVHTTQRPAKHVTDEVAGQRSSLSCARPYLMSPLSRMIARDQGGS